MMIFKLVFVCALVGAPVFGSAIKSHPAHEEASKGGRQLLAPVAHQRLVEQTKSTVQKLEHVAVEQRREEQQQLQQAPIAEQKLEELPSKTRYEQKQEELQTVQQKEELPARIEETKGQQKYEAKTQTNRDELANGQQRYEQRQEAIVAVEQRLDLSKSTKHEQKQEELPSKTKYEQKQEELKQEVVAVEQQRVELSKTSYEQKEDRYEQQQREYDQQIELKEEQRHYEEQPALVQQEEIQQQQVYQEATKGGQAPVAEAEPYAFSYQVEGSSRSESGDTKGTVRGQYTVQGPDGSSRVVDYIADHNGFRASVNTNEFGTEAKSPANIALRTSQPLAEEITLRLEGKTKEDIAAPAAVSRAAPIAAAPTKPENWQVKGTASAQLPLPQFEELPKGGAVRKTVVDQEILRTQPIAAAPAKGQRLVQDETSQQTPQQPEQIKSAELRAPKAISGDLKLAQARAVFESATAHRVYRAQPAAVVAPVAPVHLRPVVPGVVVRAQPPPVLARLPVPAVSRTYLQRERYPPSPVQQAGYRRELPVQTNPRVSFYAPASASVQSISSSANFDDEQPSSFEQSDS